MTAKSVLVRPQGLRPRARVPPLALLCYATDITDCLFVHIICSTH